jgi:hypothetical protein
MAVAIGATAAWGDLFGSPSRFAWRVCQELFPEGVASGDPDSSVLLWTRYPRGKENPTSKLRVEVAEDWSGLGSFGSGAVIVRPIRLPVPSLSVNRYQYTRAGFRPPSRTRHVQSAAAEAGVLAVATTGSK